IPLHCARRHSLNRGERHSRHGSGRGTQEARVPTSNSWSTEIHYRPNVRLQPDFSAAMKISTLVALTLAVLAGACLRQDVNNAQQKPAPAAPSGDWPTYGGPLAGDRYSPLAQITAANVGQLRQVCGFCPPARGTFP